MSGREVIASSNPQRTSIGLPFWKKRSMPSSGERNCFEMKFIRAIERPSRPSSSLSMVTWKIGEMMSPMIGMLSTKIESTLRKSFAMSRGS